MSLFSSHKIPPPVQMTEPNACPITFLSHVQVSSFHSGGKEIIPNIFVTVNGGLANNQFSFRFSLLMLQPQMSIRQYVRIVK